MLPTYPKLERFRARNNLDRIRAQARELSPMLGLIRGHVQFEGRASLIQREDGDVEDVMMESIGAESTIKLLPLSEFTEDVLAGHLKDIAEQLARGMSEMFRNRINEVTEKTGNVVDGKGEPFSETLFLDMMEKMEHRFAPDGSWVPPVVIAAPGMAEKMMAAGESIAGGKRLATILERKRDEFHSREAARILVG